MTFSPLSLLSSAGSFLGGIQTYLIVGAVTAVVAASGGAYAGYRWELSTYEARVASDAQAVTLAVQKEANSAAAQAAVSQAFAVRDQQAKDAINVKTVTITKELPAHVTQVQVDRACLSVGLMRMLRSASTQTDPDTLSLAAGQSDDDCSDVSPVTVAGWFTGYAAASEANAQQLTDLEGWVTANHAAQEANQ